MDNRFDKIFENPFFRKVESFTRVTELINDHGQPVKATELLTLVCIIQPATPDILAILPEGERYNPAIRIMTQKTLLAGDELAYQGMRWRVINNSAWVGYGYHDCVATRYDGSQADDSKGFGIA
jgi:hypothetical protein